MPLILVLLLLLLLANDANTSLHSFKGRVLYWRLEGILLLRVAGDIVEHSAWVPNVLRPSAAKSSLFYIFLISIVPHLHIPPSIGTAFGI